MVGVSKDDEYQGNKMSHYIYYRDKEKEQRGQQLWIGLEFFCLGAGKRGQFGMRNLKNERKGEMGEVRCGDRRRQWHPTPVLLPGKSHGRRSLVGCSSWGRNELDTTSLSLFTLVHWRRKWQPTPVFLPGESQGRGSLVGCCLWGRTESDTTEAA